MGIVIQQDMSRLHAMGLLERLLIDRTTGSNILWATDAYSALGPEYQRDKPVEIGQITGENAGLIRNRAEKAQDQQTVRTRKHGEVFTPLWVCNMMNNHVDEVWFGRPDVFNHDGVPTYRVEFPEKPKRIKTWPWMKYVDSRRLEITCGEAPYLVSRYDVSTGEEIEIKNRIGLLDRKLRVVDENAGSESEWLKWAVRAFEATYGYEYQGDNLLIARINLLATFEDYLKARWDREPSMKEYTEIIRIITWNVWQMDGLTGMVPYCRVEEECPQLTLFGYDGMDWTYPGAAEQPRCRIFDWRGRRMTEYACVRQGGNRVKFDFVIGNPPYQEETVGENETYAPQLYHRFLDEACTVAVAVELIHPARFLFNAGSTPKSWNQKMLTDPHFKIIHYQADSKKIFPNTAITGGIVITYHDKRFDFGAIGTFTIYSELNSILHKVHHSQDFSTFSTIVITRTAYRLTDKLHRDYPQAIHQLSKGHAHDMSTNIFERLPQVFFDAQPTDGADYIRILGREGGKRVYKFIQADYVNQVVNLFKYKIILSKADGASGTIGNPIPARIMGTPSVEPPGTGLTESFFSIGAFDILTEAESALKYIKTKFARIMLGVLKTTQDITPQKWEHVPMQDFTPSSDIDWTQSIPEIDQQLYKKYGLDEDEIEFIETHVKEMT